MSTKTADALKVVTFAAILLVLAGVKLTEIPALVGLVGFSYVLYALVIGAGYLAFRLAVRLVRLGMRFRNG